MDQSMTSQIPSVKLVLLGESSVGKSSIVARYATDTFIEGKEATIGAAFLARVCSTGSRDIKFEIWDTAGQERFHSLAPMYYRNALAAMVVYDVTKYTTFEKAQYWVNELQRQGNAKLLIALVGNKTDVQDRQVTLQEAQDYAADNNLLYIETSAKLGTNVGQVFTEIAKHVVLEQPRHAKIKIEQNHAKTSSNGCACT
ncbi:small GTPase superfamily [Mucor mucedo]|uniref:small GTPase superfamily n=1 Tax=Mucor mucedo TaxID=29922 RepID=UPI00221FADA5|nr:small GTPase superfamily [Mucor mucedo]KAI7870489.1 small GTPase superfamily [Mucor mucedo]